MANVAQLVVDKMKELDVEKNKKHQNQRTTLIYETGEINERKVALMS